MRRVSLVLRELFGLFVEDASFALTILVWLAAFALPLVPLPLSWHGVLLFAGLAVILVWHCLRHIARRAARTL